jgi:hypothetical protein
MSPSGLEQLGYAMRDFFYDVAATADKWPKIILGIFMLIWVFLCFCIPIMIYLNMHYNRKILEQLKVLTPFDFKLDHLKSIDTQLSQIKKSLQKPSKNN